MKTLTKVVLVIISLAILIGIIVAILIIVQVPYTAKVIYTENIAGTNQVCNDIDYEYIITPDNIQRINDYVEITCSITNTDEKAGFFNYGGKIWITQTEDPKSKVIMNEVQSDGYGDVFLPNVKTTKKVIISSIPNMGTMWYNCFANPPKKNVCKDVTNYVPVEKSRTETRFCNSWKKLVGKCEDTTEYETNPVIATA